MAGFGRRGDEAAADVVEQGLAKAGAGGDQRHVPAANRFSMLQHLEFVALRGPAHRSAIASRSFSSLTFGIGTPGNVKRIDRKGTFVSSAVAPSTGPATPKHAAEMAAPRTSLIPTRSPEPSHAPERGRREFADVHTVRTCRHGIAEAEQRLRAADVASKDHDVRSAKTCVSVVDINRILHHLGGRPAHRIVYTEDACRTCSVRVLPAARRPPGRLHRKAEHARPKGCAAPSVQAGRGHVRRSERAITMLVIGGEGFAGGASTEQQDPSRGGTERAAGALHPGAQRGTVLPDGRGADPVGADEAGRTPRVTCSHVTARFARITSATW